MCIMTWEARMCVGPVNYERIHILGSFMFGNVYYIVTNGILHQLFCQ